MSTRDEANALNALVDAERAGDERAADLALDRLLELAASVAGPDALVRSRVERGLEHALGTAVGAVAGTRASWLHSGWARAGSKLGLVTIGVAIGFVWGRSPEWRAERASESVNTVRPVVVASTPPAVDPVHETLPVPVSLPERTRAVEPAAAAVSALDARTPTSLAASPMPRPRASAPARRAAPAPATRSSASAAQGDDTLRIALEQLRKAQLFLSASEPTRALAALDDLDARVPAAVLAEERDVTRALALCKTGDTARAAALAARVLERAPDSAYALSLRESCAGQELLVEQMRERTSNRAQ